MPRLTGSCHCGSVQFEVTGDISAVTECNCSICRRKGYLHWIVPRKAFRIVAGEGELETYRFNTGVAQHQFCRTCGVAGFYVPRSHPDQVDVNVRCLDGVDIDALVRHRFDGANWEANVDSFRSEAGGASANVADHANAVRVRELFQAFRDGDLAAVQATIADDAVWHFPGRSGQLAGSHRGVDAILEFLLKVPQLTGGTFHLDLQEVVANERCAVALFRGHAERGGMRLDNPTALVFRFESNAVVEIREFVWDLFHVDQFWT